MDLHTFIVFYFTFGICMAVVMCILLVMIKAFGQDDSPWWSIIITALTGFIWPIAICWMIYWNLEDSKRTKKNNKKIKKI